MLRGRVREGLSSAAMRLVDLLLPPICSACGQLLSERLLLGEVSQSGPYRNRGMLCPACRDEFLWECDFASCSRCGLWQPGLLASADGCSQCRCQPGRLAQVIALGSYRGAIRSATIRMKQFQESPLSVAMGHLLAERVADKLERIPDVIVPIPKHWWKLWLRGADPARLLAEQVASRLQRPLAAGALRFVRRPRKQSLLSSSERRRNLAGALRISPGYAFAETHVLIVDDIMTTGTTADVAARLFLRQQAASVRMAVVARAQARPEHPDRLTLRLGSEST